MASARPRPAVLVVEDAISVRTMLADFFAREGYEVVHARHPEVAIRRLHAAGAAVEAIVLDVFLEGNRSGLEVLELIRLDERFVNTIVVVLTGQSPLNDEDVQIIQRNRAHLLYKQQGYKKVFESLRRLVKPLVRPAA
jgi:CheY-like chemotaxis protein